MIHRIVNKSKGHQAIVAAGKTSKALVDALPRTVELHEMRTPVRRALKLGVELLVGLLVIGALVLGFAYYRLEQGNIPLAFVVPSIEKAINGQLTDMSVKIESAFLGKNNHSSGVHFRLRNIILYNKEGEAIANAPLAAVDLNGKALMWGRIAPSQVVFIKPRMEIAYKEGRGLSLSYGSAEQQSGKRQPAEQQPSDKIVDLLKTASSQQASQEGAGSTGESAANSALSQVVAMKKAAPIGFMKAVSAAFAEARSHRNTSSYLTQFGVRDAVVNYSHGAAHYSWKVPDFIIDLHHNEKSSLIRGFGRLGIGSDADGITPWKLRFQTQQFDKTQKLKLDMGFKDITPASLQHLMPAFKLVQHLRIPLEGKLNAKLDALGTFESVFANIRLSAGRISFPWMQEEGKKGEIALESGELKLAYSHQGRKLHILPSPFNWGNNKTILSGVIEPYDDGGGLKKWKFSLKADETRLGASDFGLEPMIIDDLWIAGVISPQEEVIKISSFSLQAGAATISLSGTISNYLTSPAISVDGKMASISIPAVKRLWPRFIAFDARDWIGRHVFEGRVVKGQFKIDIPAGILHKLPENADLSPDMIKASLEASDLVIGYLSDLPPIRAPQANVEISGRQLSIKIPKGRIHQKGATRIKLSHGSFSIPDLRQKNPAADLNFRIAGTARAAAKFIRQPSFPLPDKPDAKAESMKGNVSGVISMHMPLHKDLQVKDVALKGDLRLTGLKGRKMFGDVAIEGGTVNIGLSEKGMRAKGGIVIKGIPARVDIKRAFTTSKEPQSPVRLSAVLNDKSRRKLGLGSLSSFVSGDVPVVLTLGSGKGKKGVVQVRADLTSARLENRSLGWIKARGAASVLQFDIVEGKGSQVELRNINLVGDGLVLEGDVVFDKKKGRLSSFSFPKVSYSFFDSMKISGKRQKNGILKIDARIKSLDGQVARRNFFFDEGAVSGNKALDQASDKGGHTDMDIKASIETIVGGGKTFIDSSVFNARKRNGKMEWLDFTGRLNGTSSLSFRIEREKGGRRVLKGESNDAGAAFRMIGLYPNIAGGKLSLLVGMDPKGNAEKKGTLWIKNFDVVTNQAVSAEASYPEVFGDNMIGSSNVARKSSKRRKVKARIQFDRLKAPFSYGNGQFVLHDSYVNGPIIGATLRGKIDFRSQQLRLGGTYIPLYGLNSAIGEIPILSELLVGRKGEGVFGVTFAVEGPTANPTVIVNPLSLLTPGVSRQIFDFNNTPAATRIGKSSSSGSTKRTVRRAARRAARRAERRAARRNRTRSNSGFQN